MSVEYVRKAYGVPARRGGRVEYTGDCKTELGTIRSASGGHLNMRLDGVKHTIPFHPTWKLRYLDAPEVPRG
jgi:hypothetical protein